MASFPRVNVASASCRSSSFKLAAQRPPIGVPSWGIHRPTSSILAHAVPAKFSDSLLGYTYTLTSRKILGLGLVSGFQSAAVARRVPANPNGVCFSSSNGGRSSGGGGPFNRSSLFWRRIVRVGAGLVLGVALALVVLAGGLFGAVSNFCTTRDVVPYTHREQLLLSSKVEMMLVRFGGIGSSREGIILPASHPVSVRVSGIARNIIQALKRDSRRYGVQEMSIRSCDDDEAGVGLEKLGKKAGEVASWRLDGLKWEVLVLDDPAYYACSVPGGTIAICTGLLEHLKTDAEVATVIAHEVGHTVAQHSAERLARNMRHQVLQFLLDLFGLNRIGKEVHAIARFFWPSSFLSQKMEMEADYIGLLLMASAGYDPQVAPAVFEKLDETFADGEDEWPYSTHPTGKERSRLLARPHVMGEAMARYKERLLFSEGSRH